MSSLSRRRFLGALGSAAVATVATVLLPHCLEAAIASPKKPNIIFILADDLGLDGLRCYGGNRAPTPNIDALARGGMRFETCYSTPLCGPSRAQLLTGRYPFRTGMIGNNTGDVMKPERETMLPTVMKRAGYVSASVGKWAQLPLQPGDWGFDEYWRFEGSGKYWQNANSKLSYTVNGVVKPVPADRYIPDMMHEFLVDFIGRNRAKPFYIHYPMSHVHGKIMRTPDSAPDSQNFYNDNLAYMDKLVGQLVAELDRLGLRENTLIIFAGDNGTAQNFAPTGRVNGKRINGQKASMQEGGSRVPLIANWPGTVPVGINRDLVDFSDFLPTFAQLGGATLPQGVTVDGHSFAPQLKGQRGTPREWIYVELQGRRYVRDAKWKLNNEGELFDMTNAPFEEKLVASTSTDPGAITARRHLQGVLDDLVGKNAPPPATDAPGAKRERRMKRKAARRAQAL